MEDNSIIKYARSYDYHYNCTLFMKEYYAMLKWHRLLVFLHTNILLYPWILRYVRRKTQSVLNTYLYVVMISDFYSSVVSLLVMEIIVKTKVTAQYAPLRCDNRFYFIIYSVQLHEAIVIISWHKINLPYCTYFCDGYRDKKRHV